MKNRLSLYPFIYLLKVYQTSDTRCPVSLYFPQCRVKQETRMLLVNLREKSREQSRKEKQLSGEKNQCLTKNTRVW